MPQDSNGMGAQPLTLPEIVHPGRVDGCVIGNGFESGRSGRGGFACGGSAGDGCGPREDAGRRASRPSGGSGAGPRVSVLIAAYNVGRVARVDGSPIWRCGPALPACGRSAGAATLPIEWVLLRTPLRLLWSGQTRALLFFVLSGFVLSLPWLNGRSAPYGRFLLGRFCRIYPPYIIAMVIAAAGCILLGGRRLDHATVHFNQLGWAFRPTGAAVPSVLGGSLTIGPAAS
jgi:hypothetical protein